MMFAHDETEQRFNNKNGESCNPGLQLARKHVNKMNVFGSREKNMVKYNYVMTIWCYGAR